MIRTGCRCLGEVDFPITKVSMHAAREKYAEKGHPNTLHLWWARRPLAACRAMVLGLLWPDPCDPKCPDNFKDKARQLLPLVQGKIGRTDKDLRDALLKFIGDFASWDLSGNSKYLEVSRELVRAAHGEIPPLIADPFAGGGSIPLEALRLGCEVFASDLNPVACLALRVLLEDIPRHGKSLALDLKRAGEQIKRAAEKELRDFFCGDPDGSIPIAYLWARTVHCESPKCGAEIPIFRSPWLSKKGVSRARYFLEADEGDCVALLIHDAPLGGPITFRIAKGYGSETPKEEYVKISGTKAPGNNANVICPCCSAILPGTQSNPRTASQLSAQGGGTRIVFDKDGNRVGGARLLAVVTAKPRETGRRFRLPTEQDYKALFEAEKRLEELLSGEAYRSNTELSSVPNEPLPPIGTLGFRVQRYGILRWVDLFSDRQKLSLVTLVNAISKGQRYEEHTKRLLACAFSRVAMSDMSCTRWNASAEKMQHTFGRQALPMVWDFAEVVPIADAPGNWESGYELVGEVSARWPNSGMVGQVELADATDSPLASESSDIWFTDPPYYDAVPYADLSDFFFVWLKRILRGDQLLRDPFDPNNPLTPKTQEAVQDESKEVNGYRKGRSFFETTMTRAFKEGRRILKNDGVGCVVFAHKTTEGWEALLTGMIQGGWVITASWPIATEMRSRLRARDSAALATSVHLVCRPRPEDATGGRLG